MATPKQIAANQANSQKSTGPRTEEGKAASSRNHLSHGFASNTRLMLREDDDDFDALVAGLALEHQPATLTEQILVERMALNQWLTLRAFRLQGEAFYDQVIRGEKQGMPRDFTLLMRYQSAADRAFYKAHDELLKVQQQRKKSEIGFDPQNAPQNAPQSTAAPVPEPETEPKTVPLTSARTSAPAEFAAAVPPHAQHPAESAPNAPDLSDHLIENAA